jgi:hypothetical protein
VGVVVVVGSVVVVAGVPSSWRWSSSPSIEWETFGIVDRRRQ